MSNAAHNSHAGHDDHGGAHGSLKSYLTGFILAVILTVIPFGLVMTGTVAHGTAVAVVVGLGVLQILVHLRYFLHMGAGSENGWTNVSFLFTLIVVGILVAGSVWIMYHLNHNMMPMNTMQMD